MLSQDDGMRALIAEIATTVRLELALWRARHQRFTLADLRAALDIAAQRFPHDRIHQEARAIVELERRRTEGRRLDA